MERPHNQQHGLSRFAGDAGGATLLEYALLASLATVVAIIATLALLKG